MTDSDSSTERTRRSVIKHTGVGAFALAASTSSVTAGASSSSGARLLEAAITYDDLSEPSASNVELRSYTTCPGPTYHVEDGVVRVPDSSRVNGLGGMFEDNGQLINFGGLRRHEDGRQLGRVRTQSLFYEEWLGKIPVADLGRVSRTSSGSWRATERTRSPGSGSTRSPTGPS